MENIYVFGHLKPDTDSIAASIAMSYLYNQINETDIAKPFVLGRPNPETKFALDYFNVEEPTFLNDVKIRIKDINYRKKFYIEDEENLYMAYKMITENQSTGIPVIKKDGKLLGLLRLKELAKLLIDKENTKLFTSFQNILDVTGGKKIVKIDNEIEGDITIGAYNRKSIIENDIFNEKSILILGNRIEVIEYSIYKGVKLIIITEETNLSDELIKVAKEKKVNIIEAIGYTYDIANKVYLSNYVKNFYETIQGVLDEESFYDDFLEQVKKERHTNYPVVDKDGYCLGLLRFNEASDYNKKKVILVDHQEKAQSALGIEQAEILEVIDHHKIGDITTNQPINFRNMTVGSSCTILYNMFNQYNVDIPLNIAGMMLSAVLSDTLMLKSPTATKLDEEAINGLSKIAKVDYEVYAKKLFTAAANLDGKTPKEVIQIDFKEFDTDKGTLGVGQIFLTDFDYIEKDIDEYIKAINELNNEKGYLYTFLFVTDITNDGSFIIYSDGADVVIKDAFDKKIIQIGTFLPDVLSRKKQIIPNILNVL